MWNHCMDESKDIPVANGVADTWSMLDNDIVIMVDLTIKAWGLISPYLGHAQFEDLRFAQAERKTDE